MSEPLSSWKWRNFLSCVIDAIYSSGWNCVHASSENAIDDGDGSYHDQHTLGPQEKRETYIAENLMSEVLRLLWESEAGESDGEVDALLSVVDARVNNLRCECRDVDGNAVSDGSAEGIEDARGGVCPRDMSLCRKG